MFDSSLSSMYVRCVSLHRTRHISLYSARHITLLCARHISLLHARCISFHHATGAHNYLPPLRITISLLRGMSLDSDIPMLVKAHESSYFISRLTRR
ncbi:unnamed protein product [Sphenostylis stenocarpa]|uniref:Uncharacterized protein n=1 Tax=Sphenostylis stenocarpa TaxID=92480 RepID=A0AA86SPP8_9FABA|nr:unnamed protein product [Sphenostylis stenocarpa]